MADVFVSEPFHSLTPNQPGSRCRTDSTCCANQTNRAGCVEKARHAGAPNELDPETKRTRPGDQTNSARPPNPNRTVQVAPKEPDMPVCETNSRRRQTNSTCHAKRTRPAATTEPISTRQGRFYDRTHFGPPGSLFTNEPISTRPGGFLRTNPFRLAPVAFYDRTHFGSPRKNPSFFTTEPNSCRSPKRTRPNFTTEPISAAKRTRLCAKRTSPDATTEPDPLRRASAKCGLCRRKRA